MYKRQDIYRAHPNRFQIIDGKLMPAINSIDGLGDNAAIYISEAAKMCIRDSSVTSQDTCRTIAEKLKALNLVDDAEQFRIYMGQKGADHFIADGAVSYTHLDVYKRQAEDTFNL